VSIDDDRVIYWGLEGFGGEVAGVRLTFVLTAPFSYGQPHSANNKAIYRVLTLT